MLTLTWHYSTAQMRSGLWVNPSTGEIYDGNSARLHLQQLIRYIRRRDPTIQYIRVVEAHKSGSPHLHLLLNRLPGNRTEAVRE